MYYQRPDVINDANELVDAKGTGQGLCGTAADLLKACNVVKAGIPIPPVTWELLQPLKVAQPVEFWKRSSGCPALVCFVTGDAKLMITTGEHEDVRIKNRAVPRLVVSLGPAMMEQGWMSRLNGLTHVLEMQNIHFGRVERKFRGWEYRVLIHSYFSRWMLREFH